MQASIGRLDENLSAIEQTLSQQNFSLVVAESCTGGMLASRLIDRAGASNWFYGGFVTYQALAKKEMLGIDDATLCTYGLVSSQTAIAMALGAIERSSADYSIALTGVAGPMGDGSEAHVGELWIAWTSKHDDICASEWFELSATRSEFRLTACALAVEGFAQRFC